jgi:hypothetical protein
VKTAATESAPPASQELWGITCFFNWNRSRRRLANYRLFRQHVQVPLVTVELSFGGEFELQPGDADLLVQLRGGALLWQKERLLNIALKALPSECRKVVWMDGDTIVAADDWPARVSRALDECPIVQPYDRLFHLEPGADAPNPGARPAASLAYGIRSGQPAADCLKWNPRPELRNLSRGSMWAARRELLDEHGFFDACIVGGADKAIACAAYGLQEALPRLHAMNERQREYYLAWAEPFSRAVSGSVTCVQADVFHLWHGAAADRRYRERHEGLQPFAFDPGRDIAIGENGVWHWSSDKPLLHDYVERYLAGRKEED